MTRDNFDELPFKILTGIAMKFRFITGFSLKFNRRSNNGLLRFENKRFNFMRKNLGGNNINFRRWIEGMVSLWF